MLKLKLQYFGHLIQRANLLEKTLMLGKTEGRKRLYHTEPPGKPMLEFVVVVQVLSHVRLFVTPWTAALQASLSFTISQSLFKLMSTESVMPCNLLILCYPLLLLPSIFPSIRVFSNE